MALLAALVSSPKSTFPYRPPSSIQATSPSKTSISVVHRKSSTLTRAWAAVRGKTSNFLIRLLYSSLGINVDISSSGLVSILLTSGALRASACWSKDDATGKILSPPMLGQPTHL